MKRPPCLRKARHMERYLEVTVGYRGKISTKGEYIAPGVYSNKDKRLHSQAEFLVETGRARWLENPPDAPPTPPSEGSGGTEPEMQAPHPMDVDWKSVEQVAEEGESGTAAETVEAAVVNDPVLVSIVFDNTIAESLMNGGVKTMDDLAALSPEDIQAIPNIGKRKLETIADVLEGWSRD